MAPANEGFRADQAAVRQTDLRLIEQFEFIALGGKPQFGLQRQSRFQFAPDCRLEQDVTVPGRLGAAEREMAVAQQFVGGSASGRMDGGSYTDFHAVLTRSSQERCVEG